jgi:hypothetical protein
VKGSQAWLVRPTAAFQDHSECTLGSPPVGEIWRGDGDRLPVAAPLNLPCARSARDSIHAGMLSFTTGFGSSRRSFSNLILNDPAERLSFLIIASLDVPRAKGSHSRESSTFTYGRILRRGGRLHGAVIQIIP